MPPYRLPQWLSRRSPVAPVVDTVVSWGTSTERFEALIDTGADDTHIPDRAARALNLQPISEQKTLGVHAGQVKIYPVYRANLSFEGMDFTNIPVVGFELEFGIIGRDLLNRLITELDGPARQFTLQHPTV